MTVRFGLRAPRVGRKPSAQARRFYEPQKHSSFNYSNSARFVLGAPPRAGAFGHSDWAASTPIRGRRFLSEPRYSLSTYSSSPPAESSNELRQVTAHRVGWRRTARLKEPQKLGPFGFGLSSNSVGCGLRRPARASKMPRRKPGGSASRKSSANSSAQRGAKTDCGFPARRAGTAQKLAPVLRLVSASLRLRFRSAAFSRACAIYLYSAHRRNS